MYGQFLVIFALILTGYVFRKLNMISEEMNQGLSRLIVYLSFPCFIFYKVAETELTGGFLKEFILMIALSFTVFMFYGLYAYGYARLLRFPKEDAASAEMMMIFPNNAFMGFPITYLFFGNTGLIFMIANNIAMNLTAFSYGIFILRRGGGKKEFSLLSIAKCLVNPNILALIAGLLFCSFEIGIPEVLGTYLGYLGSLCTPLAMIFIGATLVGTNGIQVIKDRIIVESVINKNFLLPVLTYLTVIVMPVDGIIKAVIIFSACFPSATVASLLVAAEGKNSVLACRILVVSTMVSVISLPVSAWLINILIL